MRKFSLYRLRGLCAGAFALALLLLPRRFGMDGFRLSAAAILLAGAGALRVWARTAIGEHTRGGELDARKRLPDEMPERVQVQPEPEQVGEAVGEQQADQVGRHVEADDPVRAPFGGAARQGLGIEAAGMGGAGGGHGANSLTARTSRSTASSSDMRSMRRPRS